MLLNYDIIYKIISYNIHFCKKNTDKNFFIINKTIYKYILSNCCCTIIDNICIIHEKKEYFIYNDLINLYHKSIEDKKKNIFGKSDKEFLHPQKNYTVSDFQLLIHIVNIYLKNKIDKIVEMYGYCCSGKGIALIFT